MKKHADLLITDFSQVPDFPKIEEKIADFWEEAGIFEKSLRQTEGKAEFVFYDGPPFATGLPHYGHLVASTTKDVFPRFQTMLGQYVRRVWGWDCHGLPIENIIEKEVNLPDRQAILQYGVENFCEDCRGKVQLYAEEWKKTVKRLGRFVDMENSYQTMDTWFMERVWGVFQQLWDKGLIYQDYKSMHICPRCSTPLSNFEVTQGYKEVTDISVFAKFKLQRPEDLKLAGSVYLMAWTTTPWTLPGNLLLAVNQEIEYAAVRVLDSDNEDKKEIVILAAEKLAELLKDRKYEVVATFAGEELMGRVYEPVFPYFSETKEAFRVVDADFVNLEEGTGIVHIAPALGEDDFQVGKREGLKIHHHVDMAGRFTSEVTDFARMEVKPRENPQATDIEIIKYLAGKNLLWKKQKVKHSYPHCWRCDYPLLNYATDSFFVKVTAIKDELIANNQKINWLPEHIKDGRFGKWLEGAIDWAISRNRFWGTPLPLWRSEEGDYICVGSQSELEKLSGQKVNDLHKHVVDKVIIQKDGKEYRRVDQVLDCWFESGSMPYTQPAFPADFISEGQDQTRGWFYTLHVLATALRNAPAFRNVIVSGVILAADGKKMSKKLKNYPDPQLIFDKYGADALRLYLMTSPVMKAENLNFNEEDVARLRRQVSVILWNVYVFYRQMIAKTQQNDSKMLKNDKLHVMDQYLQVQTEALTREMTESLLKYDVVRAGRALMEFVNELSTWYLRASRERLKVDVRSQKVLGEALARVSLLMAPLMPFLAELLYQNLDGKLESVHLEKWPAVKENGDSEQLRAKMELLKQMMQAGNAKRKELKIRNRQPLAQATFAMSQEKIDLLQGSEGSELLELLKSELNVKKVELVASEKNEMMVELETKLTPELIAEGQARELMREIASERKKLGLRPEEKWSYRVKMIPEGWEKEIETKTNTKIEGE